MVWINKIVAKNCCTNFLVVNLGSSWIYKIILNFMIQILFKNIGNSNKYQIWSSSQYLQFLLSPNIKFFFLNVIYYTYLSIFKNIGMSCNWKGINHVVYSDFYVFRKLEIAMYSEAFSRVEWMRRPQGMHPHWASKIHLFCT